MHGALCSTQLYSCMALAHAGTHRTSLHHFTPVQRCCAVVYWCIGAVHWCIDALVHWCIGSLVYNGAQ